MLRVVNDAWDRRSHTVKGAGSGRGGRPDGTRQGDEHHGHRGGHLEGRSPLGLGGV